jgi:hypothetical protein
MEIYILFFGLHSQELSQYDFILVIWYCSLARFMSADTSQKPKSRIAFATIRMPDGKEHEIPLAPKTFSSGREGYYSQIPSFVYENEVYGGQIQIWKKGEKGQTS